MSLSLHIGHVHIHEVLRGVLYRRTIMDSKKKEADAGVQREVRDPSSTGAHPNGWSGGVRMNYLELSGCAAAVRHGASIRR